METESFEVREALISIAEWNTVKFYFMESPKLTNPRRAVLCPGLTLWAYRSVPGPFYSMNTVGPAQVSCLGARPLSSPCSFTK